MRSGSTPPLQGPSARRAAIRPALLALALTLAVPTAEAGWLNRLFGAKDQPRQTQPETDALTTTDTPAEASPASPSTNLPAATPPTATPVASHEGDVPGNVDDEEADAEPETPEAEALADSEHLPNVEESELGAVDSWEAEFNPDELAEVGDLWNRMRNGFQMDLDTDNDRIAVQRNWYLKNNGYLNRMALRATRYLHHTVSEAEKRGLPTELALLPVIESAYDPFAYSHAHAAGMWQFIPGTARIMGVKQNWWFDGRRDVLESTRAGYDFLTQLYEKFGDWQLALAAYNAGPGAVQRAINRNVAAGLPTDFWSLRLPAETRAYVPRFIAVAQIIKSPESFGISLRPVLDKPFFTVVETQGQVDMTAAARIAGVSLKELYQLNPGFNRQATDPEGPHRLLVPAHLPVDFREQIAALPVPEQVVSQTYTVQRGDTISSVARRFNTTAADIRRLNHLKGDTLALGRQLTLTHANVSPEFVALNNEIRLDRLANGGGAAAGARSRHYTVRSGDTLSSIAKRQRVSVAEIKRWNSIKGNSIRAGQRLTLRGGSAPVNAGKQRVASHQNNGLHKVNYKVRNGDTLSAISRRYNVSVKQIQNWNSGSKASNLQAGQRLTLFVNSAVARNF